MVKPPVMNSANDDLLTLENLHRKGVLTAEAYHAARAKLLASPAPMLSSVNRGGLQERWHVENQLFRAETAWQTVRESLIVRGKDGREHVPNAVRASLTGVVVAALLLAAGVMQNPSGWGGVIAGLGVAIGGAVAWDGWRKAQAYTAAEASHRREMDRLRRAIAAFDSGADG